MHVTALLVKEGTHKALLGAEKKPSKMEEMSGWISIFEPIPLLYYAYQMKFFTM